MTDDLEEARRLMALVAGEAERVGEVDPIIVINMAKVWAHIALAEAQREQTAYAKTIATALETIARGMTPQ
jgi:hypothetical protein